MKKLCNGASASETGSLVVYWPIEERAANVTGTLMMVCFFLASFCWSFSDIGKKAEAVLEKVKPHISNLPSFLLYALAFAILVYQLGKKMKDGYKKYVEPCMAASTKKEYDAAIEKLPGGKLLRTVYDWAIGPMTVVGKFVVWVYCGCIL